jgi:hypothetical protein
VSRPLVIWYVPITAAPPSPVSEASAATAEVIVYVFASVTVCIWYSWLRTRAVITPPRVTASEKVTKSPSYDPFAESVTVIIVDPFVAAKVTSPADVIHSNRRYVYWVCAIYYV